MTPEVAGSSPVNHPKPNREDPITRRLFTTRNDFISDRTLLVRVVLLSFAFVVPLTGAAGILIGQQALRVDAFEREADGLLFTNRLIIATRSLRALREQAKVGEPSDDAFRRADGAIAAVRGLEAEGSSPELLARIHRLQERWSSAHHESAARRLESIDAALQTMTVLSSLANLRDPFTSDPDTLTAGLVDAYGNQLPAIAQHVDDAALAMLGVVGEPAEIVATKRVEAAMRTGQAKHASLIARRELEIAARKGRLRSDDARSIDRVYAELLKFGALSFENTPRATEIWKRDRALLAAVSRAEDDLSASIGSSLQRRIAAEQRALTLLRIEALLAIFVGVVSALLLARTIRQRDRRELERARETSDALAAELERKQKMEALAVTEAHFRAVFERSAIGVAILDRDGTILRSNRALLEMFPNLDPLAIGANRPQFERLFAGEIESLVSEVRSDASAELRWFEVTLSLVRDDAQRPRFALSMIKDVSERKRIDERLRHDATHDVLSGLPNRTLFFERLAAARAEYSPERGVSAVLFVDLDEFKFVNDSLGHAIGDRVIIESGQRLRRATRVDDCVARFGGDEFAVLLAPRATLSEIDTVVERLGARLAEPIVFEGHEIFVTASIGVNILSERSESIEEVLRDADTAMYVAKSSGRARSVVFTTAMHETAVRRLELATQVRRALDRGQITIAYQPVVALDSGIVRSCEALMRWRHPDLGEISPSEFIPIAEEIGVIGPLGRFALETACEQFATWKRTAPRRPQRISVNASVREIFQTDYVQFVTDMVQRYGIEPGELVLEITESTVLTSGKYSATTLERLKGIGVGLAIDDFGTGYSSLRYLQQFPFDELKIDRSFVSGFDGRLASEAIVTMLISLARACKVSVIAEGVETSFQAARLRALGCASAQGYLYGQATSSDELLERFTPAASIG